jgi:hypothetical protein
MLALNSFAIAAKISSCTSALWGEEGRVRRSVWGGRRKVRRSVW